MENVFSVILRWLRSTGVFTKPSRQIPGKWQLFEYYTENAEELFHVVEEQLINQNRYWEIAFSDDGMMTQRTNISFPFSLKQQESRWSLSRNYLTIIQPDDFRNNVEFQFAIVRGNLKLLKKNSLGRIEFFGFFRKQEVKSPVSG